MTAKNEIGINGIKFSEKEIAERFAECRALEAQLDSVLDAIIYGHKFESADDPIFKKAQVTLAVVRGQMHRNALSNN